MAEGELAAILPMDISLHVTRLCLTGSSPEELMAMTHDIDAAAALIGDVKPDLTGFHCTAVSTRDPALEDDIVSRATSASSSRVVATSGALIAAFKALDVRKIVLVTPYLDHIVASEVAFLERHGITVLDALGLGLNSTDEMASLDPQHWYALTCGCMREDADAYFLSCTAIRTLGIVEPLEAITDRPVLTSNQVMAWHLLRQAGFNETRAGFGQLLSQY
ncbi:hypothetical protein AAFO90_25080 [Phaeobacter sp. CAU 1743]|uniref:maleate cis-trans isomerase family protein n=1 Tax=Phaeobacter sp. CAU 1743 TaxID=3140367 RepID=UPI00325A9592